MDQTGFDPGNEFATFEGALQDAFDYIQQNHAGEDREYGGFISAGEEGYTYSLLPGDSKSFRPGVPGPLDFAAFHRHGCETGGNQYENFSGEGVAFPPRDTDIRWVQGAALVTGEAFPAYLFTPRGAIRRAAADPDTMLVDIQTVQPQTDPTGADCGCK